MVSGVQSIYISLGWVFRGGASAVDDVRTITTPWPAWCVPRGMKYASVVIPLVVVGVLFLAGCVWVAMRTRNDEGDEESVMNVEHEGGVAFTRPKEQPPTRAHTIPRPAISVPSSLASTSETTAPGLPPPRYER
ncbi:hypothetical protein FRC12_023916 [Ceratobasidium sp. 428]|nr:hypothetical protein FRC12_023916 [Ceratobasidium sp. 428]